MDFSIGPFLFCMVRLFSENVTGNKNTLTVTFASLTLHSAYHESQFPTVGNHIVDHGSDHGIVGCDVLKTDTANVVEVQQFGFLEI